MSNDESEPKPCPEGRGPQPMYGPPPSIVRRATRLIIGILALIVAGLLGFFFFKVATITQEVYGPPPQVLPPEPVYGPPNIQPAPEPQPQPAPSEGQ